MLWLIQDVKDIDRTLYLENGLPAFEEALSHAQAVAADPKTQEEIDAAINTLTDAYLNLRLKPSEELLQSLKDFVALAGNIDASLFSADELSGIQALTSQISDRMISGEMDLQEAEALNEKAQSYTALIQERMAAGSTASTNASNTAAGVSKAPAASRSVKTAFSTGFASMAAAGLASLGGLLSLRRRKK